jgi:chromosome segregation ATPase
MNPTQLKDKLIAMKEKVDKYDELFINYKNLERKHNELAVEYDNKLHNDILNLSSKLCNLRTDYLELQIAYNQTLEELESVKNTKNLLLDEHNESIENIRNKMHVLIGENDDFKGVINSKENHIIELNKEIENNEEIIQNYQSFISCQSYEKNNIMNENDNLKEKVTNLTIFNKKLEEDMNNILNENLKLKEELENTNKNNDLFKSVIDELGISEWDIIDKSDEIE